MSAAVFRTMWLGLVRDRGALAMSFLLPIVFFVVFAAIFAGATGEQMRLRLAVADEVGSDASRRLVAAVLDDPAFLSVGEGLDADAVRALVRRGTADVGLIMRAKGRPLDDLGAFGPAPVLIVTDPVRGVAGSLLAGQVQKAYFVALPDVALGNVVDLLESEFLELSEAQRREFSARLADFADEVRRGDGRSGWSIAELHEREDVIGQGGAVNHVGYYAGAVAILFLLFSCAHGAITLLEERDGGILDRVLAGPGRAGVLVSGKFAFLVAQGFAQVSVIFLVAWWGYGVDLPRHVGPWAMTTLAVSVAASGLVLALVAACRTRRQAQTLANVVILVVSALGGSMVPRFLMPESVRALGWITPNTWALEAYSAVLWRGAPASECIFPWLVLLVSGIAGLVAARGLARRTEVL